MKKNTQTTKNVFAKVKKPRNNQWIKQGKLAWIVSGLIIIFLISYILF